MSDPIASILGLCELIRKVNFGEPGIFSNAMLSKLEVTSLIRDALPKEQNLYRITRRSGLLSLTVPEFSSGTSADALGPRFFDLLPERVDGSSVFVERHIPGGDNDTAVAHVPELVVKDTQDSEIGLLPEKGRRKSQGRYSLLPKEIVESNDVDTLCSGVYRALEEHPGFQGGSELQNTVLTLQKEYTELLEEVLVLNVKVNAQKLQLDDYHEDLDELLPSKGNISPRKVRLLDDVLRREEEEILRLEAELALQSGN